MIIVNLKGGIGNQLFQYALGRHLSLKNNTELLFDISTFRTYKWHKYSLNLFSIEEKYFKQSIKNWVKLKMFSSFTQSRVYYKRFKLIEDTAGPFDANILNAGKNTYLDGYWQSEKYFKDIRMIILKDLEIKRALTGINKEISESINAFDSVSIHIRRGNYVSNSEVNRIHGTCTSVYYDNSILYILQKVQNPHFFIFSDEIDWAKSNFRINYPHTFVDNNKGFDGENYQDEKNVDDLRLMSQCKHNIIANSSFSWWGAWLNKNPGKIVIAPLSWYKDQNTDTRDLLPDSWVRL